MVSVLFVCLANICRSPAAEGILRHMISHDSDFQNIRIESCGIGDWHVGQLADERIRFAAKERGVILSSRAQHFRLNFLEEFDYLLALDREVLNNLYRYANQASYKAKIHLISEFSKIYTNEEIPDPYYHGEAAFELVLDMIEDCCKGFLEHLKSVKP
jgi:protein-tyrosine phosphatase